MLKGLRPPTHRLDVPGEYVFPHDDAWDHDRVAAERAELIEMALAAAKAEAVEAAARQAGVAPDDLAADKRETAEASVVLTVEEARAAVATHPVDRYLAGETRYQLDAPDQGPRGPACAGDYLRPDAAPTRIILRRVPYRQRVMIELERDHTARWVRWVQAAIASVSTGSRVEWAAKDADDQIPESWIEVIAECDGGPLVNLINLAGACSRYSAQLTSAEKNL